MRILPLGGLLLLAALTAGCQELETPPADPPTPQPSDDDDSAAAVPPPEVILPTGSVPCTEPLNAFDFEWTLRWGGWVYPNDNAIYDGWVKDGGTFTASFTGLVESWGEDESGKFDRFVRIVEEPPPNSPPPPDPDWMYISYSLPEGVELGLTVGQLIQAELNISREGMVVPTGVALWAAPPYPDDLGRTLIALFEGAPGGLAYPPGEEHLFEMISSGETSCPNNPGGGCPDRYSFPVNFTLNERFLADDTNRFTWEIWPGTRYHFATPVGEFELGLDWAWKFDHPSCPYWEAREHFGFYLVNTTYQYVGPP
jgi:hypothetical protein